MTAHTPGPWHVHSDTYSEGRERKVTGPLYDPFYAMIGGDVGREANTTLIAAAPELLEAAEAYFARVDAHLGDDFDDVSDSLRAAITKARGEVTP